MENYNKTLSGAQREKLSRIKHVALDMDGTIYLGNNIFPYTIDFLQRLTEDYGLIAAPPLHQDGICFYQPRIGSNKVYALIAGMLDHLTHWHIPHEHVGNGAILPVCLKPVRGIPLFVIVDEQDANAAIL